MFSLRESFKLILVNEPLPNMFLSQLFIMPLSPLSDFFLYLPVDATRKILIKLSGELHKSFVLFVFSGEIVWVVSVML
jgi:hypothetical protein